MGHSSYPPLADSRLRYLIHRKSRSFITWSEFLEMSLPVDMSARETWEYLQSLYQCMGIAIPFEGEGVEGAWYFITLEMARALDVIELECGAGSAIDLTLRDSAGRHFLTEMRIDDLLASASLDGLHFSPDEARRMLQLDTDPRNHTERLMKNALSVDASLAGLTGEPMSIDLIEGLYARLIEGVNLDEVRVKAGRRHLIPFIDRCEPAGFESRRILQLLTDYCNAVSGSAEDTRVLRLFTLLELVQYIRPFGVLSSQMGRFVCKLYAAQSGIPVMSVLPLSKARLEWELGHIGRPHVICSRAEMDVTKDYLFNFGCIDLTLSHTVVIQLALLQIERIKTQIQEWNDQDKAIRNLLQSDLYLNQRQRTILARAIRSPNATFCIRYHQKNHAIAYATARHDLMDLCEKGYLVMAPEGRAYVFRPAPDIVKKMKG